MKKKFLLLIFFLSFSCAFAQLNNGALYFNGVDDVVSIPNTYNISSTADFTVEAWIRANSQPVFPDELNIIGNREDVSGINGFRMSLNLGSLTYFGVNGGSGGGPNLLDSVCHHVAVKRQSSIISFYIDGTLYSSVAYDTTDLTSSEPYLFIGAKHDPQFPTSFHGLIKEVRFWNIARTTSEIVTNMNTIIASQPNLIGYWRCDDSTGQAVNDYALNNDGVLGAVSLTESIDPAWAVGCISFPTGVEDGVDKDIFQVYPNPVDDELNIEMNSFSGAVEFILYDSRGQILLQKMLTKNLTLKTDKLSSGFYIYNLKRNGVVIYSGTLIKQ